MEQYLRILEEVRDHGHCQANRTGIDARVLPFGSMMRFDMADGFPAMTTKKLAFNSVKGELIGFLRGYTNAAQVRVLGSKVWDQNANDNAAWLANPNRKGADDTGRIYGAQWRSWKAGDGSAYDQLMTALNLIHNDPTSRRIVISAWRPDEFDRMCLPPCHVLYQFIVNIGAREINLCMYQRSADLFLGVPFNIASASTLLHIVARITGYTPRYFTHFLADAHIYVTHLRQVSEQLTRTPRRLPRLVLDVPTYEQAGFSPQLVNTIEPGQIHLEGYDPHPVIKAEMAV
jgi:thymidylate synthase